MRVNVSSGQELATLLSSEVTEVSFFEIIALKENYGFHLNIYRISFWLCKWTLSPRPRDSRPTWAEARFQWASTRDPDYMSSAPRGSECDFFGVKMFLDCLRKRRNSAFDTRDGSQQNIKWKVKDNYETIFNIRLFLPKRHVCVCVGHVHAQKSAYTKIMLTLKYDWPLCLLLTLYFRLCFQKFLCLTYGEKIRKSTKRFHNKQI